MSFTVYGVSTMLVVTDCPSEEAQICTLYSYANWDGKHQEIKTLCAK
jgi:hypothetical protein